MHILDAFLGLLRKLLRLALWGLMVIVGLALVSVGLMVLLGWLLVMRLLGRQPPLAMAGRMADWQRFAAAFQAGRWPHQAHRQSPTPDPDPQQADSLTADGPEAARLPRRAVRPQAVTDVEARDLPPSGP